jgi:histidine triad (HIT) family protein
MMLAGQKVAAIEGVNERGYRLVMNCGQDGGQVVQHAHLHVLGGDKLTDKMG